MEQQKTRVEKLVGVIGQPRRRLGIFALRESGPLDDVDLAVADGRRAGSADRVRLAGVLARPQFNDGHADGQPTPSIEIARPTEIQSLSRTWKPVHSRLPGDTNFTEEMSLKPSEDRVLIKYEEDRRHVRPIARLVFALRVVTPAACVATLDDEGVLKAALREDDKHRWTIRMTPGVLTTTGCRQP